MSDYDKISHFFVLQFDSYNNNITLLIIFFLRKLYRNILMKFYQNNIVQNENFLAEIDMNNSMVIINCFSNEYLLFIYEIYQIIVTRFLY